MSDSLCLLTPELPAWNRIYPPEINKYFPEILEGCHILLFFNSAIENKLPSLLKGNLNMSNCCLDLHIMYFKNHQEMNISDCLIEINCIISTTLFVHYGSDQSVNNVGTIRGVSLLYVFFHCSV